eukprot:m.187104 g.187104  ORF g.187104 m.187104 type:complete len:167 (-) comp16979_c0_seq1:95-595(-)
MASDWDSALCDQRFDTFEDPFSGMCVPKQEFDQMYGPACRVLLMDLPIHAVFEENPVMQGQWRYSDDDARDDLYDTAVDMGLVPSSDEVRQGETFEEERARKAGPKPPDVKAVRRAATIQEKADRLVKVITMLEQGGLSGKQRKKLLREQRGLFAAVESSTESITD